MSSSVLTTGEIARNISNSAVGLIADYTGRGPTKARTTISGDWVFITLEDTLTKGERRLAANGHAEAVLETRRNYQRIMRDELERIIEEHTGRKVTAFMSDNHIDPDVAIEAFQLEPDGDGVVATERLQSARIGNRRGPLGRVKSGQGDWSARTGRPQGEKQGWRLHGTRFPFESAPRFGA